ncbi:hypothetical protein RRM29_004441 [Salmonella enterica]|nr:hypothetical protein [Salmonella enterica]EDR5596985.1 hypothetical protein [Salmonella enterica subsp. diarizonae]EBK3635463.1 hypothetical protein [Salmonella enterica]EGW0493055.1 hypothetical protein [Salmonella enterica]EIF8219452.1 hypothetical protein [Salmonella enterica]
MRNGVYIDLELGTNPFYSQRELKIEIENKYLIISKEMNLVEKRYGKNVCFANILHVQEVDSEEFINIYTSKAKEFFELTKSAYKVFLIFFHICQDVIENDCLYLSCKKAILISGALENMVLSGSIFYRGIKELIDKKIIAKSNERNWYFINPSVIFNGGRARFATEIIKKKDELNVERVSKPIVKYDALIRNRGIENIIDADYSEEDIDILIAKLQDKKQNYYRKPKVEQLEKTL